MRNLAHFSLFVCHNTRMSHQLLIHLVSIYALLSFGMLLLALYIYHGHRTNLMKVIFQFWLVNFINLVFTSIVARSQNPFVIFTECFVWPFIYYFLFKICQEFAPNLKIRRYTGLFLVCGYSISCWLFYNGLPFHLSSLPGILSLSLWGLDLSWQFKKHYVLGKMNHLEKVFWLLMASFFIHVLDWPFLRMNFDFALYGYTYFLFNIIGFACAMPAMALQKLGQQKNLELEALVESRTQQLIQQSKLSALGEMAAGVAHEINNPLSIIVGRSAQLRKKCESTQEISREFMVESLQKIEATAFRISKIVKALRDFSRQSPAEPFRTLSVQSILDEVFPLCHERFFHSGVSLTVEGEVDAKVIVHGIQISQVFLNLLNNAFDAVENLDEKWIKVLVKKENHIIEIRFLDSGEGIPGPIQDKIMDPFFTTKEIGKGTGLGLSISKGIVENHKGHFFLDHSSRNTAFVVQLPA